MSCVVIENKKVLPNIFKAHTHPHEKGSCIIHLQTRWGAKQSLPRIVYTVLLRMNKCFSIYFSLWVLVYSETMNFWTFIKRSLHRCTDNLVPDTTAKYIFSAKYFLPFYEITKVSSQNTNI
jgi:hypothetical protein